MNKTQKTEEIAKVKERFDASIAAVLVNFQGLDVATVSKLRRDFRKGGVDYKVVKNNLIRHALNGSAYQHAIGKLERVGANKTHHASLRGMTGVAWCKEDPSAAAKVIVAFKKDGGPKAAKLAVKAGLIGGEVRNGQWVEDEMSKLPGLKETQAMLLATLQAPAQQMVGVLSAPARNLVTVLQNWVDARSKEGGA
ncbi:MAG: 50S ribosomal protein L10 [Polyangiales bacterium]